MSCCVVSLCCHHFAMFFFPCGTADGWDSADQHLLSRVACSILDPDWEGHAVMLSVQDILA